MPFFLAKISSNSSSQIPNTYPFFLLKMEIPFKILLSDLSYVKHRNQQRITRKYQDFNKERTKIGILTRIQITKLQII